MILDHIEDAARFRAAIRGWLPEVLSRRPTDAVGTNDARLIAEQRWWREELAREGLVTPHWPKAYGGIALDLKLQAILAEEYARFDAPSLSLFIISLNHVLATLMRWGSEDQKRRYLPGVGTGTVWCQGFSEPNAGSDLASLRATAVRDGDDYVVNGQKIWSSFSMYADRAILLARTDPSSTKHAGISFFLMDMKAPGVDVRPILQSNGKAKFAEIFLTDVRIPVSDLVGEEGQGWAVAQTTLSAERGLLSFENAERLNRAMQTHLRDALAAEDDWTRDTTMRARFTTLFARLQAVRRLIRDLLFDESHDAQRTMIASATIKVLFSALRRDYGAFRIDIAPAASQFATGGSDDYASDGMFINLTAFGGMIGGGTNEIMRNIIAERGLGMPRG